GKTAGFDAEFPACEVVFNPLHGQEPFWVRSTPETKRAPPVLVRGARTGSRELVSETELLDQRAIGRQVAALQIGQQPPPGANHLEQASAAVMIFGMGPEVIGEGIDSLGQQGDLDPGRPGVVLTLPMRLYYNPLVKAHSPSILI